ncbi:MAG: aminopeptidase P family protein [Tahibacter sp.]
MRDPQIHSERLTRLRQRMREWRIDAVIVPSADPHLSEYLPERWQGRLWLSGFSGSVGTAVVTQDMAGLWTDSRYFEQAERELAGSEFSLMRLGVPNLPDHVSWLAAELPRGSVVAAADDVLSLTQRDALQRKLDAAGIALRTDLDPLDAVWDDRPGLPAAPVRAHAPAFALTTRAERLSLIRAAMRAAQATHHLVSALDDIAWITVLRGSDIPFNPVFLAHLLITPERCTLFVDVAKLDQALRYALAADDVDIADYAQIGRALAALPAEARLMLDPARMVVATAGKIPPDARLVRCANPSQALKSRKSEAELAHVRQTMQRDGVALVRFLIWLEDTLTSGSVITELDIAAKLLSLRREQAHFVGESFTTIAGYLANGALPHYRATAQSHATLERHGLLLVDSGGQYEGGTTDITRTIALGPTTEQQRRDYTLVLKGMIALSRAKFPQGTSGQQLDAIARAPIWAEGIDYGHGTGHGVGYFLNVHEGPQTIRRPSPGETGAALAVGMITSNEPGIYRPGQHGVRIENLIATVPAGDKGFGDFLAFETLTLCPIDTRPIERERLRCDEREWLNVYHDMVREQLSPLLGADERRWLAERCAAM